MYNLPFPNDTVDIPKVKLHDTSHAQCQWFNTEANSAMWLYS